MAGYDAHTIYAPNPLARYAHRKRLQRSLELAVPRVGLGRILDYGCGTGVFVSRMNGIRPGSTVGYEPYMRERTQDGLPIFSDFREVMARGPFHTVTLFETIEHLTPRELDEFLSRCEGMLAGHGAVLISAPIEIGPALLLKEANRLLFQARPREYALPELFKAAMLGVPGRRAGDVKESHKGFDFRASIGFLRCHGWATAVQSYGPIPLKTWYGNSQVFLLATRASERIHQPAAGGTGCQPVR